MIELKTPKSLGKIGKKEWKRVYVLLKEENLDFSEKDATALESYAADYETWINCSKIISEEGYTFVTEKGYLMQRPEVSIGKKANESMRQWAKELGLTPSSRAKMKIPIKDPNFDEELDNMISHG